MPASPSWMAGGVAGSKRAGGGCWASACKLTCSITSTCLCLYCPSLSPKWLLGVSWSLPCMVIFKPDAHLWM